MQANYNLLLVALSYAIAAYASFAFLNIVTRLEVSSNRKLWMFLGAITMGLGIWSMHFVGMLAYEMDMPVTYSPGLTLLSGVFAIAVSSVAMYMIARKPITLPHLLIGGLIMGTGVSAMHYTGMAAMDMPMKIEYDTTLFSLSVVIAISASIAALVIASYIPKVNKKYIFISKVISALVMGIAVSGMHYTGMAATIYIPMTEVHTVIDTDYTFLLYTIVIVTILTITFSLISSYVKENDQGYRRTALLAIAMTCGIVLTVGASIQILFNASYNEQRTRLEELIKTHAELIAAVTRFDAMNSSKVHKEGARAATISQIIDAHNSLRGFGETGEFYVIENDIKNNSINFHVENSFNNEIIKSIKRNRANITPFINSLNKQGGVMRVKHFNRGEAMLSAYNYIPELSVGLVAMISLDEIRAPYVASMKITSAIALLVILFGTLSIFGITYPSIQYLRKKIEEKEIVGNELRELTTDLDRKVLERTIELEQAIILAEDAAKSKAEFLANMSHEIRTPMNGVLGMLQLMQNTLLNKEQQDFLNTAQNSAEMLLTILNDILDLSKIESGNIELESIDFSLLDTIEDVATLLAEAAHRKNVEIITSISADVPLMVKGDPTRLRQILMNLTSNAIKFTDEGEVIIKASVDSTDKTKNLIRLEIKDTGIGIAQENKGKIFQSFKQEDGSTTRKFGGTGLGLAISKQLSELMGGDLQVDSVLGEGSTFWFAVNFERSSLEKNYQRGNLDFLSNKRLLIVDDNETNRTIFEHQAKAWGLEFDSAEDAYIAANKIKEAQDSNKQYDFIWLDMMMPGKSGLDLASELNASNKIKDMKIIMLTSLTNHISTKIAKNAGIKACLSKPVKQSLLLDSMMSSLSENVDDVLEEGRKLNNAKTDGSVEYKILVAEDNKINQKVIGGLLKNMGHTIEIANNGQEAINALKEKSYDVVFMDCNMPEVDGYEATKQIRKLENRNDTLIIAMTANAMQGDKEQCIESGMDDYISKPVKTEKIKEMFNKWLVTKDEIEDVSNG